MKTMIAAALFAALMTAPAFAGMSCKDFNAMDSSGQMKAVSDMHDAMGGSMKSDEMKSGEMKSGEMKSDNMQAGGKGTKMTGGAQSSDDGAMMTKKVADACKSSPDMMVGDAMKKSSM